MSDIHSDALVFFGATGDLAYKKIFPALQAMAKRGTLDVPVIGVAKAGWTLDQLRARARESVEKYGGLDRAAFDTAVRPACATSTATTRTRRPSRRCGASSAARRTRRTTSRFRRRSSDRSSSSSPRSGCATGARVVVEKPFGDDLASARELNRILLGSFDEARHLPDRPLPRQAAGAQHAVLPVRERVPRGVLEPDLRRERADHDGRGLRRPGARRVLRRDRHHPRRHPEPSVPGVEQSRDGAAGENGQRVDARREGEGAEGHPAAGGARTSFADSSAATGRSRVWLPIRRSRRSRRSGSTSIRWRWQGVPFYIRAGKSLPVTCTEIVVRLRQPRQLYPSAIVRAELFPVPLLPRVTVAFGVTVMDPDDQMIGERSSWWRVEKWATTRWPPTSAC